MNLKDFYYKAPKKIQNSPEYLLRGVNGQIEVYNDRVVIKRKGFLAKTTQGFFKGDKTFYINQLSGVQVKHGTVLTRGYIQFVVAGSRESKGGLYSAVGDENTVMFAQKDNNFVDSMQQYIEKARSTPVQQVSTPVSMADEIKKFKQLLDDGVITQAEFDKQKAKLLG